MNISHFVTIKSKSLVDILSFKLELDLSWIFSFDDTLCQCVDIDATQSFLLHERDDRQQTLIAPLSRKKKLFRFEVSISSDDDLRWILEFESNWFFFSS